MSLDWLDLGRKVPWGHLCVAFTFLLVTGRFSSTEELEQGNSGWKLLVCCCLCPFVGLDVGLFERPLVIGFAPSLVSDEPFFKVGLE